MRTSVKAGFFVLFNVIVLTVLVRHVWSLLSLLVVDGSQDVIPQAELPVPVGLLETLPQLIPKIIHQTYKNETIPEVWRDAQRSCLNMNPEYEYMMWTDAKAREFIAAEYSWFLETYDSYPYPIQRADCIRYFVLVHFGGIYIDLDDGCRRPLDPLLHYPAWLRKTIPTGISNDVMGSTPGHPFFIEVINSLKPYQKYWFTPYITIMATTGPLFLSLIWSRYNKIPNVEQDRVRILSPDTYMKSPWSFFSYNRGSSWHQSDAQFLFWMSKHWAQITIVGFVVGFVVIGGLWCIYDKLFSKRSSALNEKARKAQNNFMPRWMRARSPQEIDRIRYQA